LPRGPLWALLLTPPLLMVTINLLIGGLGKRDGDFLPVLPIGLLSLIVCQGIFAEFIGRRFPACRACSSASAISSESSSSVSRRGSARAFFL
jgi:hypothetical protein